MTPPPLQPPAGAAGAVVTASLQPHSPVPPLAAILEAVDVSLAVSLAAGAFWLGQYTRGATARVAALEKWRTETNAILTTLTTHTTDHGKAIRAIYELLTSPASHIPGDHI